MKKGRFLWSAHRITERQKAGKARNIKEKRQSKNFNTVSKQLVVLHSSARDNFLSQDNSIRVATPQDFGSGEFFVSQEITSYETKTLREDRHGAEENFAAETTRRRRRSLRAGFFLIFSV
jgi:hypothetical protein